MSKKTAKKEVHESKLTTPHNHGKHQNESSKVLVQAKKSQSEDKKELQNPEFNYQPPNFLKSTLVLLAAVAVILSIFISSLALSGQYSFQKDTQAQFAKINQELKNIRNPKPTTNLQQVKAVPEENQSIKTQSILGVEKLNPSWDNFTGSPNNRFSLIVYVDMECPFCKIMHENLIQLQKDYPNLTIVYRHYPLEKIHRNALTLAKASECAKNIGGANDFFRFTNSVFLNQNLLRYKSGLLQIIQNSGMDALAIEECVRNNDTLDRVKYDQQEAMDKLGSRGLGTPTSILFDNGQETNVVINGAAPYPMLKNALSRINSR